MGAGRWWCPAPALVHCARRRRKASTRSSATPASSGATPWVRMYLGMNPDILLPPGERSARQPVEPQLRGPPGPRRSHAPRPVRRWPLPLPSPVTSWTFAGVGTFRESQSAPFEVTRFPPSTGANVDTDQIIPAKQNLKRIERTGYGPFAFEAWRNDPNFVLNDTRYAGAHQSCLAQEGTSASGREPRAPPRVGHRGPRRRGGDRAAVRRHLQEQLLEGGPAHDRAAAGRHRLADGPRRGDPDAQIEVDLAAQVVRAGSGWERPFQIDPFVFKHRLLNGLDDIGLTLAQDDAISAYEAERERGGPVTTAL